MSALNVVVWGLGNHAKNRILPALSTMDGIKLIGVCSRDSKIVEMCANQWHCHGWSDPEQMLSSSEVDVVYISTPIGTHFSLAKKALQAGKHVWCEKPLTCNYTDTQALTSLAEMTGKALTESFMYLYHPQFNKVKGFVYDSIQIRSVTCRFGIPILLTPGFRNNPKLCGGAFWDVATYTTSALLSIFPDQRVEVLFAELLTKENSPVDNEGRAILRFDGGVTAYLEWGTGISYKNEIDLWGEDSSFFTDKIFSKPKDYQPQYRVYDLNGNESVEYGESCEQFIEMFRNFVRITNDKQKYTIEREIILQRAKLMNDIFNFNGGKIYGKLEKY
jgi:dTDP-3,4-didehydro-2,6-dideoxy-alpha-D-glucose 3-reductase